LVKSLLIYSVSHLNLEALSSATPTVVGVGELSHSKFKCENCNEFLDNFEKKL